MPEHEHLHTDGLGTEGLGLAGADERVPTPAWRDAPRNQRMAAHKIECNACPVLCQISEGKAGACDRYANQGGQLLRVNPVLLLRRSGGLPDAAAGTAAAHPAVHPAVPFQPEGAAPLSDAALAAEAGTVPGAGAGAADGGGLFITAVGASTTYPDYKPAPFIVSSVVDGVDMVTVVTEGIFSYCSLKVKIDTDRWLGPEQANVRCQGEVVGHVSTAEYGSQMLSLGGVHHITGGGKKEGRITVDLVCALGNQQAVDLSIDGGAQLRLQAGAAPVVNGVVEQRMRVGCGSATIGIFAQQLAAAADEVVVVDDHITGVLTEHQAGRCLGLRPSGLQMRGRKSTPGRWFQVAQPGTGWGGTDLLNPLAILDPWDAALAWPGQRLLMVSTTGEHAAWFVLDEALQPQPQPMPEAVRHIVDRIGDNCEPSLCSVLFVAGAGGSLRAGVTDNPVQLTRAIQQQRVRISCGGAPAYVWPGGGITVMVDVARMPAGSFGSVPTPAIVAPIEFTLRLDDYRALGGHMAYVRPLAQVLATGSWHHDGAPAARRTQDALAANPWPLAGPPEPR